MPSFCPARVLAWDRSTVEQQTLTPLILVRILVPQPHTSLGLEGSALLWAARKKRGGWPMASLPCRSWRASDAQRTVNDLSGDNCVVRSAAIHFFIAQQSDPAVWLKLLVNRLSDAARHRLCRFVF